MTEYDSATPSPAQSFPSPARSQRDLFVEDSKPQLYGPASLSPDVIMVPPSSDGRQTSSAQPKQDEVIMLATLADLELGRLDNWPHDKNMVWLKCMLSKHLPQPQPHEVHDRLIVLKKIEERIGSRDGINLEGIIEIFREFQTKMGHGIADKLEAELEDWREVRQTYMQSVLMFNEYADLDKGPGDHLWEHILRLLMNKDPTVEWLDIEDGLFRFADSSGAARSWGMTKGNQNMSYEKMSRSIRQYYNEGKDGIIQKAIEHPKLHYKFNMRHPEVVKFLKTNFFDCCLRDPFLAGIVECFQ